MRKGPLSFIIGLVLALVIVFFLGDLSFLTFNVLAISLLVLGLIVGFLNLEEGAEHLLSYLALLVVFTIVSPNGLFNDFSFEMSNVSLYVVGVTLVLIFKTLFDKLEHEPTVKKLKPTRVA